MRGGLVRSLVLVGSLTGVLAIAHCAAFAESGSTGAGTDGGASPSDSGGAEGGAGTEGGAEGTTDAGGGCTPLVADGFELMMIDPSIWPNGLQTGGKGSASVDFTNAFTGKGSLRVDVPAGSPVAYLEKALGARTRVRHSFAMRAGVPTPRTLLMNSIELGASAGGFSVYFAIDNGVLQLREQRFDQTNNPTSSYDLGTLLDGWHTYGLTIAIPATGPATAEVVIDGVVVPAFPLKYPLEGGDVKVRFGLGFAETGPTATSVWLDDVMVCAEH